MAARIAEQSKHSVVREPCRMGCWRGWRARLLDDRRDVVGDEGCLLGLRVIQETGVRHPVDKLAAKEVNNEQQEQERCRERNLPITSPPTSVKGALLGANYFSRSQPTC